MKVPTADYSPIEQAIRSKTNAIQASYYAKDASNWKIRHERSMQAFDLQEQSLALQQQALDLSKWTNTVNTVLSAASQGLSFAENIYKWKVNNQQNTINALLTQYSNEYEQALTLYGDEIQITEYEDGTKEVVKPQQLIDLEEKIWNSLLESDLWIPKDLRPSVEASLNTLFSAGQLKYLENIMQREANAQNELYVSNLNQAIKTDVANGLSEPLTALAMIDQNTNYSETEKQIQRDNVWETFRTQLSRNEVQNLVKSAGLSEAYSYIESLDPQYFNEDQISSLKQLANTVLAQVEQQAALIADDRFTNFIENTSEFNASSMASLYDEIDELFSNEAGYTQEYRDAYKAELQIQQRAWANEQVNNLITEARKQSPQWVGIQELVEALTNPDNAMYSWYYGLDDDRNVMVATLNNELNQYKAIYGEAIDTEFASRADQTLTDYLNGNISADKFWSDFRSLAAEYRQRDPDGYGSFDPDAYISSVIDTRLKEAKISKDMVLDGAEKRLQYALGIEKISDLDEDEYGIYWNTWVSTYAAVDEWITYNLGNFSTQQLADFMDELVRGYTANYFDLLGKDLTKDGFFTRSDTASAEWITKVYNEGLISIGSMTEEGYVTLSPKNSATAQQLSTATDQITDTLQYQKGANLASAGPQIRIDNDDGSIHFEYPDKNGTTWDVNLKTGKYTNSLLSNTSEPATTQETIEELDDNSSYIRTLIEQTAMASVVGEPMYREDKNGNIIVFFETDYQGYFAYNPKTGKVKRDNPFEKSKYTVVTK